MNVLHTGTLNVTAGGPAMSTYLTLKGLIGQGVKAEIVMYELNHGEELRRNDVPIHYVHKAMEQKFQYSPSYEKELRHAIDTAINNDALRQRIIDNGLKNVKRFSLSNIYTAYKDIYCDAMKRSLG